MLFRHTQQDLTGVLPACRFITGFCWLVDTEENCQGPQLLVYAGKQLWNQQRSSQPGKWTKGGTTWPKVGAEKETYIEHLQEIIMKNVYTEKLGRNESGWLVDTEENCQVHSCWCTLAINHGTSTEAVSHESEQKVALPDLRWAQKKKPTSNIYKRSSWRISTWRNSAWMNLPGLLLLNLLSYL